MPARPNLGVRLILASAKHVESGESSHVLGKMMKCYYLWNIGDRWNIMNV